MNINSKHLRGGFEPRQKLREMSIYVCGRSMVHEKVWVSPATTPLRVSGHLPNEGPLREVAKKKLKSTQHSTACVHASLETLCRTTVTEVFVSYFSSLWGCTIYMMAHTCYPRVECWLSGQSTIFIYRYSILNYFYMRDIAPNDAVSSWGLPEELGFSFEKDKTHFCLSPSSLGSANTCYKTHRARSG